MKVSEHPNIDRLLDRVTRLKALLEDPQPGLFTWCEAYAAMMSEICGFWQDEEARRCG